MKSIDKAIPGGRVHWSSDLKNTLGTMADDYRANRLGTGKPHRPGSRSRSSGIVSVVNASGTDYFPLAVLGVDSLCISPENEGLLYFYHEDPIINVVDPTSDHEGRFVILLEPIPDGGLGLAIISGLAPVIIHYTGVGVPERAEVVDGIPDYLEGGDTGSARVLLMTAIEVEEDSDEYFGLVVLGDGAGESAPAGSNTGFVKIVSTGPLKGDWKAASEAGYDNNGGSHYDIVDEGNGYLGVDDVLPGVDWGDDTIHVASIYHRLDA